MVLTFARCITSRAGLYRVGRVAIDGHIVNTLAD
jgi:hypothetical protein